MDSPGRDTRRCIVAGQFGLAAAEKVMTSRANWFWISTAAALFAFIFFYQRHAHKSPTGPVRLLANFKTADVTTVQVRPEGQLEIRAERTNGTWVLTQPLPYPAEPSVVESLLVVLERLTPATYITRRELATRPRAEEEYGFGSPQATIIVWRGEYRSILFIGAKTAPGDQVFVQVVGDEGAYVVDADLLKFIPRKADNWRNRTLLDAKLLAFDRLVVTNAAKTFELQRDRDNSLWRVVTPDFPARADSATVEELLQSFQPLRAYQFISDDPKADLESFGLQAPTLILAFAQGTNTVATLQFGKVATNNSNQSYARRLGNNAIVTVAKDLPDVWRASTANAFRDNHLLALTDARPVAAIDARADDNFSLVQTNGSWRVLPQNFFADAALVKDLLTNLSEMKVSQVKDVVPTVDLPTYGLAAPSRLYVLKSVSTDSSADSTNALLAELQFGTNQEHKVFARRTDESSIYEIQPGDFLRLASASYQFRDRRIWDVSETNVASVTVRQDGKERKMLRKAQYEWALAPGSQGIIESLSTEETVRGLCHLAATAWVARGETNRQAFGCTNAHSITIELKNGNQLTMEFGRESPSSFPYGGVTLDGDFWVFEYPLLLCRDALSYLKVQ
jgi:Domain of unknown function (DUF4340)